MSYTNFESARVKEELRNEKRKAREAVLEKAEADFKRRKEREQRAAERGEDKWMLPSLDAQLQPDSHKKQKKHKKEKKKKEKKHKHKKKHDSSESGDTSEEEEWVEQGAETQPAADSGPAQRDEWMTLPALFPCVSREQIRAQKRQETPVDEETLKKKFLLDNPGQSDRELNPFWKDGGKGLPQMEEPELESLSLAANSAGDHGLAWLRKALRRVQEQAKEQGRSEEAVAAERWGSLEKLKSMLAEAERRCRTRPRDRGRGRGRRVQGPAPKPREYDDWREDPTAGESAAAQSEVVGDKSRYRSWLGLKDPSPRKEPSSEEDDDFNYDKLDDPPVIEGPEMKEKSEKGKDPDLGKDKSDNDDDDDDDDEEVADGKILFRSSKNRKDKASFGRPRLQVKERLTLFAKTFSEKNQRGMQKEGDSDDEDKLFEEWRNERKMKNDESDDESENRLESNLMESKDKKRDSETKQKTVCVEEGDAKKQEKEKLVEVREDGSSRNIHPASSSELRDRFFQVRNKVPKSELPKEKGEEIGENRIKGNDHVEISKYSNCDFYEKIDDPDDRDNSESYSERRRNWSKEPRERRERTDEKDEYQEYADRRRIKVDRYQENSDRKRDDKELDRRKESSRERMESSFRDKRKDDENCKERSRHDEKSRERIDEEIRNIRRSEDRERHFSRGKEREDYRERKERLRHEDEHKDESRYRNSRDRESGSRRTEIPDYLRKHNSSPTQYDKVPPRKVGFRKPEDDSSVSSKSLRHDILGDASAVRGSSRAKNWMKKEFRKPEEKKEPVHKERSPPSNSPPKQLPTIQPMQPKEKIEERQPDLQMTDAEMNALGAKVLKAELLGNQALAAKLKAQLAQAQAARQQRKTAPPPTAARTSRPQQEETVVLTQRDSKGFVRPLEAPTHPEPSGGRRRPQRVATHGADGLRERFFPDDDKYTLENMFQKEKTTTMEESNEEFCRLAAKGAGRTDSEYDLDDIFAEKASREKAPGKLQALERNRAIQQHKRIERSLDSCIRCFDSPKMLKHLLIALGSKVYLSLPAHQSLTEGHCLLAPIHHVPCATQLDEDVWEEMASFRKALVAMFLEQEQDCIFFESAMHLKRFPHMLLECVPVPKEIGDTAPIYFKKAIMESEVEWSMNKKLVDLKGKGVRRAVPKGLPYFAVDFGNDDGFAHVIEDEKLFPENFAQEIIGGMMDLDHSLWRKQRREDFDSQRKKVLQFADLWKKFDVTKKTEDSSSSDGESDQD